MKSTVESFWKQWAVCFVWQKNDFGSHKICECHLLCQSQVKHAGVQGRIGMGQFV